MPKKQQPVPKRGVAEPPTSQVLIGPREGFIEDINSNVDFLKKRIKHSALKFKSFTVGRYTQTQIQIAYIEGIAEKEVLAEVIDKVSNIDIDGIIDSSYIADFLEPKNSLLYKVASMEEKPDIVSAKLLEGRIAILVDGSPIVLCIPHLFLENIQNSNDYYGSASGVSFKRMIRLLGGFIAIFLPGFYLALALYHLPIIPFDTLSSIANSGGNNLFPPILEMLFVLLLFDIISEATVIMPKQLGSTISIVAIFVLGDVAASVGLVSAPTILVVAISIITAYILPNLISQISLVRFILCIVGGLLGLFGLVICLVLLLIYTAGIDNFGSPYLAPFAPYIPADQKDAISKVPLPDMTTRPRSIPNINPTRSKKPKEAK